jgi:hypothetical protein
MLYRLGDMSEGRGFFYKSKRTPAHEGAQFIPGGSGYGELKFYQNFDTGAVRAAEKEHTSQDTSAERFSREIQEIHPLDGDALVKELMKVAKNPAHGGNSVRFTPTSGAKRL